MSETTKITHNHGGIGFCGLLGIVFITLKLTSVIDWSWVWVLAPLWIPFAACLALLLVIDVFAMIGNMVDRR